MPIYVDDAFIPFKGSHYCHMATDDLSNKGIDALHAFAQKLGLKAAWYQGDLDHPHYDVAPTIRAKAIAAGAIVVDRFELVRKCTRLGQSGKLG